MILRTVEWDHPDAVALRDAQRDAQPACPPPRTTASAGPRMSPQHPPFAAPAVLSTFATGGGNFVANLIRITIA
jgi:hypothetical protein